MGTTREFLANAVQAVPLNQPIVFDNVGTGVFTLRGGKSYQITYNGNIALPTGATVVPIAVAVTVNGEARPTSRAIFPATAVDEYGNVTSTAIVAVPCGCCFTCSVRAVSGTDDPTVTPAPIINVQNSNLVIKS